MLIVFLCIISHTHLCCLLNFSPSTQIGMGSSETFSLSASFVEAYMRTGCAICLHVWLCVCLHSDRWLVELPAIIVRVVCPSPGADFSPSTHLVTLVCKCNQKADELFRRDYIFLFDISHASHTQTLWRVHRGAVPHSNTSGLAGKSSEHFFSPRQC